MLCADTAGAKDEKDALASSCVLLELQKSTKRLTMIPTSDRHNMRSLR